MDSNISLQCYSFRALPGHLKARILSRTRAPFSLLIRQKHQRQHHGFINPSSLIPSLTLGCHISNSIIQHINLGTNGFTHPITRCHRITHPRQTNKPSGAGGHLPRDGMHAAKAHQTSHADRHCIASACHVQGQGGRQRHESLPAPLMGEYETHVLGCLAVSGYI